MIPAQVIGNVTGEGIYLLGYLPIEAETGYELRAINLGVTADIGPTGDYYRLQFGTVMGTVFTPKTEVTLNQGFRAGHRRWALASPARLRPGDLIAMRAVKTGSPATVSGLSVALEYGILGARR